MNQLDRKNDPTGFLNLFRYMASMRYGDPAGRIQGQGRQPHLRKAGPGRRRTGPWNPAGTKLWNKCPEKRNFEIFDSTSGV